MASHFKREVYLVLLLSVPLAAQPPAVHLPAPEHGLRFETPVTVWDEAVPLGNGMLGALVWGDGNPVRISLDRADLWDLRPIPEFFSADYTFERMLAWHRAGRTEDLLRLYEAPYRRPAPTKIPAGRIEIKFGENAFESASLDLGKAVAVLKLASGTEAEVFVHAVEPLGLIRIRSAGVVTPSLIPPAFAGRVDDPARGGIDAGDLRQLGYPAPDEPSGDGWRAFSQQGYGGFRYAVYLTWRAQGSEWLGAWSIASSFEAKDPLAAARKRARRALEDGYDRALASHARWWDRFWHTSSVRVPNPVLQKQYFLDRYKFGAAARRGAPPITLQAVWTADNGKLPPWKGDFHHDLNTQLSYWPCYAGNNLDLGLGYLDWLWKTRDAGFDWTKRFFRLPGLSVPMTTDLNGRQIGGWRQYTHSATTAAWLAYHFYLHWKYSADRRFLAERAWPYLRDAAIFLDAFTARKGPDGLRVFPISASPEIHDNRPEAWFDTVTNYDLALTRWLFAATAELADELDRKERGRPLAQGPVGAA